MRAYGAFLTKEVIEAARTYKAFALIIVFLIFGIMNPLAAKFLPELVSSFAGDQFSIVLPEPTAVDSWLQFFKNITQLGVVVMIILFSGVLSRELSRGTLINLITKGLSRTTVILAKYSLLVIVWTLAFVLCALITLGYTDYLFDDSSVQNLVFSLVLLWLFGILLLSVLLFASSMLKSNYACLLGVGIFVVALMTVSIIPQTAEYNPLSLATASTALMMEVSSPEEFLPAVIIAAAATILFVILSIVVFRKRAL